MSEYCNLCGREMDFADAVADFKLYKYLGYGTKYDGDLLDMKICCKCMERLIDACAKSPVTNVNPSGDREDDLEQREKLEGYDTSGSMTVTSDENHIYIDYGDPATQNTGLTDGFVNTAHGTPETSYMQTAVFDDVLAGCVKQSVENGDPTPVRPLIKEKTSQSQTDVMPVEDCDIVHNATVYGFSSSVRGAKFPMATDTEKPTPVLTDGIRSLATSAKGSGHDQWLTGVIVQFDLTFSVKAWVEAERYHFFDFVGSQSTMHRITKFNLDESYNRYVDTRIVGIMKSKVKLYNEQEPGSLKDMMYLEILYSNPTGFLLTARMTTNYRQLKTIYAQRKDHRLPEWRQFCAWIEKLPHSELITGMEARDDENH